MALVTIRNTVTGQTARVESPPIGLAANWVLVTGVTTPQGPGLQFDVASSTFVPEPTANMALNQSAVPMPEIEIDLGYPGRRSGKFTVAASGLTTGKSVAVWQAAGPYTGKGTLADECEMDQIDVQGRVTDPSTITCFWKSNTLVGGNFKFNLQVGA